MDSEVTMMERLDAWLGSDNYVDYIGRTTHGFRASLKTDEGAVHNGRGRTIEAALIAALDAAGAPK